MTSRPGEGNASLETNNKVQGLLPRLGQQLRGLMAQVLGQQTKAPMQSLPPLPDNNPLPTNNTDHRTPGGDAIRMYEERNKVSAPDTESINVSTPTTRVQYIPDQIKEEKNNQLAELADLGLNINTTVDQQGAEAIRKVHGEKGIGADQKTGSSKVLNFPAKAA